MASLVVITMLVGLTSVSKMEMATNYTTCTDANGLTAICTVQFADGASCTTLSEDDDSRNAVYATTGAAVDYWHAITRPPAPGPMLKYVHTRFIHADTCYTLGATPSLIAVIVPSVLLLIMVKIDLTYIMRLYNSCEQARARTRTSVAATAKPGSVKVGGIATKVGGIATKVGGTAVKVDAATTTTPTRQAKATADIELTTPLNPPTSSVVIV